MYTLQPSVEKISKREQKRHPREQQSSNNLVSIIMDKISEYKAAEKLQADHIKDERNVTSKVLTW